MREKCSNIYKAIRKKLLGIYACIDWTYVSMMILVVIGYILIHDLIGDTLFVHNEWDSYTLQAKAWLDGKLGLGSNYTHLELAIYKGNWYVSFPPIPAVLMIPWVLIYGINTPNNMIMILYIMIALTLVYVIAIKYDVKRYLATFWAVFVVFGSNMLWMSTMGGVWFQAQLVNMILLLAAIYAMLHNKRTISYIFIALAVGCRPFSIVYFFVLLAYYYIQDKKTIVNKENDSKSFLFNIKILCRQLPGIVCAGLIGAAYMIYNYVRFDNPLEFGHNYLPEFMESEKGQFNISYIGYNLYRLFIRGITLDSSFGLNFSKFDGFWMYVANPIFIVLFVYIIRNIIKKKYSDLRVIILLTLIFNLLFICLHKTLGGWQFGARYMVDLIPFTFLYILMTKKQIKNENRLIKWEMFLGIFALMFNIYGVMYMYIDQITSIN